MSFSAHAKETVHYRCVAKLFGFGSTNICIVLYLAVLKIAIWFFSTTNNNALRALALDALDAKYLAWNSTFHKL